MWRSSSATLSLLVAILAISYRYQQGAPPPDQGTSNAATAALLHSAALFRTATPPRNNRRSPRNHLTGVSAEPLLEASAALMPVFDAYGPLLSRAARADLLGNVRKLRTAGAGPDMSDVAMAVVGDPNIRDQDGPTMALFWLNRILQQIAATFEELLNRPTDSLTNCATSAYLRVTAPYNAAHQRAIGRILLKIIPDRASFVRCYGQPDFESLKPVFEEWLRDSRGVREAIDGFYEARPEITPPKKWKKWKSALL